MPFVSAGLMTSPMIQPGVYSASTRIVARAAAGVGWPRHLRPPVGWDPAGGRASGPLGRRPTVGQTGHRTAHRGRFRGFGQGWAGNAQDGRTGYLRARTGRSISPVRPVNAILSAVLRGGMTGDADP